MVVDPILAHVGFGRNDNQEDVPHFSFIRFKNQPECVNRTENKIV